ncbi:MAG: hypothetical protein ACE361_10530 [Aureliella sp.]
MKSGDDNSLDRFFTGISEYVFHTQLGVVDTQLVGYVSELLIRFTRLDSLSRVRQSNGKPTTEVVSMVVEAEKRVGEARREVHRHIGDYTLFWSGLYPESLRKIQSKDSKDQFVSYCAQGKRAYEIASQIASRKQAVPNSLLNRLSEHFEMCAYGLREIRREWERRDDEGERDIPILL